MHHLYGGFGDNMKNSKRTLYLALSGIVITLYLILTYVAFFSPKDKAGRLNTQQILPTPITNLKSPIDVVQKNSLSGEELTSDEIEIRSSLLSRIDDFSYIEKQKTFTIVYMQEHDVFQVRILKADIEAGKKDAFNWLLSQGLSTNGACKLPFVFYINPKLLAKNSTFNPIPKECMNQ